MNRRQVEDPDNRRFVMGDGKKAVEAVEAIEAVEAVEARNAYGYLSASGWASLVVIDCPTTE